MPSILKKAVVYARFSSKMQMDGASIELQLDACREFASKNDYTIIDTYVDEAVSGTKESQRIRFMEMINDAETRNFDTVLVYKYNRFARNMHLQIKYEDLLDQYDIRLIAVTENYGDNHQARLLKMISAWSAENDILQISENVLRGQKARAREGIHCGGVSPLGYDLDSITKNLILAHDVDEVNAVKMIFDLRSKGYGYTEILKCLDRAGINHNKKGQPLRKTSLIAILKNEKYTGTYVFNKSAAKNKHGKRNGSRTKDESEIIRVPGGCPQIITQEIFDKAQAIRLDYNRYAGRSRSKRIYLLSGLIKCSCGASYHIVYRSSRPGHKGYVNCVCSAQRSQSHSTCHNKGIELTSLTAVVLGIVQEVLSQDVAQLTHHLNEKLQSENKNNRESIPRLTRKITEIDKKIKNLSAVIANGLMDGTIQKELEELIESKNGLQETIAKMKKTKDIHLYDEKMVRKKLSSLSSDLTTTPTHEAQLAVATIIRQITVYQNHIEINLNIPTHLADSFTNTISINRRNLQNQQYNGPYLAWVQDIA